MLITISMVFCFCWLPLNLIGTLMDYDYTLFGTNTDIMTIIFMSCHIAGMCSACINPVIYGFCNESIRSGNNLIFSYNVSFKLKVMRPIYNLSFLKFQNLTAFGVKQLQKFKKFLDTSIAKEGGMLLEMLMTSVLSLLLCRL